MGAGGKGKEKESAVQKENGEACPSQATQARNYLYIYFQRGKLRHRGKVGSSGGTPTRTLMSGSRAHGHKSYILW